jgi:hypothetical protein
MEDSQVLTPRRALQALPINTLHGTPRPKPRHLEKTPRAAGLESLPVSSATQRRNLGGVLHDIIFPPGAMGLDLEPLISSVAPERLIGCKVKEFYFGIDHSGIEEEKLRSLVSPGDIISAINGAEVLFSQFHDILNQLRNLKLSHRKITFKKLSADGESERYIFLLSCPDTYILAIL